MTAQITAYAGAVPPETARDESARRELQGRLAGLGDLNGKRLNPEQKSKKLREACEGFESVFIQKMWQEMRATLPKGGLMQGREEQFWQGMYDQELAKKMSSAGGIGLADMMYAQLSRNLGAAGKQTAHAQPGTGSGIVPDAAPLLPQANQAGALQASAGGANSNANVDANSGAAQAASANGFAGGSGRLPSVYDGPATVTDAVQNAQAGTAHVAATPASAGQAGPAVPEVEAALASLRMQHNAPHAQADQTSQGEQALQPQAQALAQAAQAQAAQAQNQGRIDVLPANRPGTAVPPRPREMSGLDLAETARREAGTKLGSNAVRPPLHPVARRPAGGLAAVPAPAQGAMPPLTGDMYMAGQNPADQNPASLSTAAQMAGLQLPGTPAAVAAAAQSPQAAMQPETEPLTQRVTYTTNIPKNARGKRGQSPIRSLNVDRAGPGSKAGAGLAAYHEAQAAQAALAAGQTSGPVASAAADAPAGQGTPTARVAAHPVAVPSNTAVASGQPASLGQLGQPGQPGQSGQLGPANSFAIPPLTAMDARS